MKLVKSVMDIENENFLVPFRRIKNGGERPAERFIFYQRLSVSYKMANPVEPIAPKIFTGSYIATNLSHHTLQPI